jgi:cleavage and polyadenylation specificity factor subunit 3
MKRMLKSILHRWYVELFLVIPTLFADYESKTVVSSNDALKSRVEVVLDMALTTISSLAESYGSGIPPSHDCDITNKGHNKSDDMKVEMEAVPLAMAGSCADDEGKDNIESDDSDSEGSEMLEVHN